MLASRTVKLATGEQSDPRTLLGEGAGEKKGDGAKGEKEIGTRREAGTEMKMKMKMV